MLIILYTYVHVCCVYCLQILITQCNVSFIRIMWKAARVIGQLERREGEGGLKEYLISFATQWARANAHRQEVLAPVLSEWTLSRYTVNWEKFSFHKLLCERFLCWTVFVNQTSCKNIVINYSWRKCFIRLILVVVGDYKNIPTMKVFDLWYLQFCMWCIL